MQKTESRIQQEIIIWFRNNYCLKHHDPRSCIFSVPNDSANAKEQMRKIATGLMSGVSDLIVVHGGRLLFVECKDDKGRQSEKQQEFQQIIEAQGFSYHVVRSLDEFKQLIP